MFFVQLFQEISSSETGRQETPHDLLTDTDVIFFEKSHKSHFLKVEVGRSAQRRVYAPAQLLHCEQFATL